MIDADGSGYIEARTLLTAADEVEMGASQSSSGSRRTLVIHLLFGSLSKDCRGYF